MTYQDKTFNEKCEIAKSAAIGSVWINVKTGRECVVYENTWRGVYLKHSTGRDTLKQHHYFAGDYHPKESV